MKTKTALAAGAISIGITAGLLYLSTSSSKTSAIGACMVANSQLMFDTSSNCASQPSIDRVFGSQVFEWGTVTYIAVNTGNDIRVYDTRTDAYVSESDFERRVGHVGDSDYDLFNFSICDGCRYGVANYKKATVLFDMGISNKPGFGPPVIDFDARTVPGAFTFKSGGQQYLIASDLADECSDGSSTLYKFNGATYADLVRVGCVNVPNTRSAIIGGYSVGDYLYLGDKSQKIYIFRFAGESLTYISTPWQAYTMKDKGLAIDIKHSIAIEANNSGMHVWNIADPGAPVELASVTGDFDRAAIKWPLVFVTRSDYGAWEHTFDISNPADPIEFDTDFWNPDQSWNWPTSLCSRTQAGAIVGDTLYLFRYSRMQRVDLSTCWPDDGAIFADGWESGDSSRWSSTTP